MYLILFFASFETFLRADSSASSEKTVQTIHKSSEFGLSHSQSLKGKNGTVPQRGADSPESARDTSAQSRYGNGDMFVWVQLDIGDSCDPYPDAHTEVVKFVSGVTSIMTVPERRKISLKDDAVFSYPFAALTCKSMPRQLGDDEIQRLRLYLISGGTIWIDDSMGARHSPFDGWVRSLLKQVLPDADIEQLGQEHPVYRSFFLLRALGGRTMAGGSLEGLKWGHRTAVIYSRNDVLGAWMKDSLGKPLYACIPGGEIQRMNAKKLLLNIIMYSLTGSYKLDAVHQPFIMEKLRQRDAM